MITEKHLTFSDHSGDDSLDADKVVKSVSAVERKDLSHLSRRDLSHAGGNES
jgi:hypothetical protein